MALTSLASFGDPAAVEVSSWHREHGSKPSFLPSLFEQAWHVTHKWEQQLSAAGYLETLRTYSDHRDLERSRRRRLLARIAAVIDQDFGGQITKHWLTSLTLARLR